MRTAGLGVVALICVAVPGCGRKAAEPATGSGSSSGTAAGGTGAGTATAGASTGGGGGGASGAGTIASSTGAAGIVDPVPTPAPEDASLGVNLALGALGGHVVSPAEAPEPTWRVSNLLDGFPVIRGIGAIETSLGWRAETPGFPQAVVVGFHQDRKASIAAVVIDTASDGNLGGPAGVPKDVEVQVSTTSATDGFTTVAAATLPAVAGETTLRFAPVAATWVKLVIASTHDNAPAELGELGVYEAAGATSVVADLDKNLLLPALGGSLIRFTSQVGGAPAAELVDGKVSDGTTSGELGWSSEVGPVGSAAHMPQRFTFAFRDHRVAMIDRVTIDPTSGMRWYSGPKPNTTTWPKTIEILTSDSPWDGFTSVKVIDVPREGKPISVPIGKPIRFLEIRILENHGADRTTLGEVQAFEGAPTGGRSVFAGRPIRLDRAGAVATAGQETAARREREPNNAQKEADRVDAPTPIGGTITPEGDRDVFLVPGAPGATGKQTLTVAVEGQPAIRTRVTVTDAAFATKYVLDPSKTRGTRKRFSVVADPGDLFVQVIQPPAAQVVVWDTSGSMVNRIKDLEIALRGYLAQVQPTDRVNLIRFADSPEVLLKDFTGQRDQLAAALEQKLDPDGGTSIYDSVGAAVGLLSKAEGSRAIVLMTDGEDTTSKAEPPELWHALDTGRTRLYSIGLGNGLRSYVARAGTTAERVLANTAAATGGRYRFVAESANLAGLYAEIGAELRAPATYAIAASAATGTGTLVVKAVGDRLAVPPRVELVLDASGSMKRKMSGKIMMDIAKAALTDVVARLPSEAQVALRFYGHRTSEKKPGACEDTELVVPFARLDRKELAARIKRVRALGTTPIAYALARAGEDLRDAKGPAILILVTDGKEECGGDPAAAAAALRASGLEVTLSIVGFGLTDAADRDAMTKVATQGGGTYLDAQGEDALRRAVDKAMAVPYTVVDVTGAVVGRGMIGGDPIAVPAGMLTVQVASAGAPVEADVPVVAGKPTQVELRKNGDEVGVTIVAPDAGGSPP